jgi:hypothetical protein
MSEPVAAPGEGGERKHPVVACDKRGQTILVWAEVVGWERGGSVAWQVFDKDARPTAEKIGSRPGHYREAVIVGEDGRVYLRPVIARDIEAFAGAWDRNLKHQGFVDAAGAA